MCTSQIRDAIAQHRGGKGLSSGGYEGGGGFVTKAMGAIGSRKRSARLPVPPPLGITEDGAI